MTHTHFRVVCSCGNVIGQCRCPGEKREEVVVAGCAECRAAKVVANMEETR